MPRPGLLYVRRALGQLATQGALQGLPERLPRLDPGGFLAFACLAAYAEPR